MIKRCPICFSRHYRLLSRFLPYYSLGSEERFFKCLNCGMFSLDPFPSKKIVISLYCSGEYRNRYQQQNINWIGGSKNLEKYLKKRLIKVEKLLKKRGRLLDIGAGSGAFLAQARKRGWKVKGIELDPQAIQYAKRKLGITLFRGELFDLKTPKHFFDVVQLNHVLEHIYNPVELLKRIKLILKPGGYLIIEVPNEIYPLSELIQFYLSYKMSCRYFVRKFLCREMTLVKLPPSLHLLFFNNHNLKQLLEKTGFKVVEINTPRRNKRFDRTIYKSFWMSELIYFLERKFKLGPNIEVFASV